MRARDLAGVILEALARGHFPMAERAELDSLYFVEPEERAVFFPRAFHVPRRLARRARQRPFEIFIDRAFDEVIAACAQPAAGREETWINRPIREAYCALHRRGIAHSVECWRDGVLCGGLYGVALGAAFFGESMFSRVRDASKIALIYLAARLRAGGFTLLDAQFPNPHLEQFGLRIMPQREFQEILKNALQRPSNFHALGAEASPDEVLQAIGQTS